MSQKASLVVVFSLAALVLLVLATPIAAYAASSQSSSKFAAYNITATNGTRTFSAVVNETLAPSSTSGMSDLTLQLSSAMSNLSYSRLVNSSYAMLPVIPNVGNFSFSQQFHNVSVSASITKIGTGNAAISGSTYVTTSYSFQVTASRANGKTITASGELSTLPSGLLYSATINAKGYTIQVALLGTNAALSASSQSSSTTTSAAIIGGSGAAIVGLGAFAFYKRRSSSSEPKAEGESKPLYHVD